VVTKTVVLARARGTDAEGFRRWLLTEHAPRGLAPLTDRLVLQLGTPGPDEALPYDVVIELWSGTPLCDALAADEALAARAVLDIRASEEVIAKDERDRITIGGTPGISQISFTQPIAGMAQEETLRHWSEHIPLACTIHVGMNRYVQDRLAPGAEGAAPWFGMAHLHFPDEAALRDGLFRTPADIEAITADVAEFVSHHATMLAVEHVIKA
jgi:uncharacterized protein (TIGR02118 family)